MMIRLSATILPQVLILITPDINPMKITTVAMKCKHLYMFYSGYTYAKAENQN